MGCGCFFAKGSAESHSQARQAQRCRAVRHRTRGRAGWRYAYPAYGVLSQAHTSQARPAQRRRAGHLWRYTRLVPDGATLIRPTGASHRLIPRRPGKRSVAGQDTSGAIPVLCRMAPRLSGLRGPLTGSYLVGPVSTAPPGDDSGYGAAFMPGGGCA